MDSSQRSDFACRKAREFSEFLKALIEANEYADDLGVSRSEFALGMGEVSQFGLRENDLRWMLKRRWIELPENQEQQSLSNYRHALPTELDRRFIISEAGVEAAQLVIGDLGATARHTQLRERELGDSRAQKPAWDNQRHELTVGGVIVKRFRWPAINQEAILNAFEEDQWPARIDDPLSRSHGLDPKRRLGDTIKCLNRNQNSNVLRFRGDGTGEGVLWDWVAPISTQSVATLKKPR